MKRIITLSLLFFLLSAGVLMAEEDSIINVQGRPVQVFLETEQGFFAVLKHTLQFGEDGTVFDYRTMGGQEILYPFERYLAGLEISGRHRVSFLYQPLTLVTNVRFKEDVRIDGVTFPAETPMELTYGFPFYRVTYGYDFLASPSAALGAGAALQLRNASIRFRDLSGDSLTVNQNLGPVPAVYLFAGLNFPGGLSLSAEATGLYASSAFINGANFEFEGSVLDASLRMGYRVKGGVELFGNLRFLGGSAVGVSQYPDRFWTEGAENYTANYLATMSMTIGATIR